VAGAPPRIDSTLVVGADAVRRRVAEIRAVGGDPQVQAFHEGPLVAYAAVAGPDGRVVADAMQAASRIWPPHAGASCRARTVPVDEEVAARAARLFGALGWTGLAELQFVVPPDGVPRLIDLNGRFYGSLALAVAAGANLPATWAALATGRAVAPSRARAGVRYQWLDGDLRRARRERSAPDLLTTLGAGFGAVHSIFSASDPAPALAHLRRGRAAAPVPARGVRVPSP
jgi:predicted ATP-grasp superfamily ATP-dependent carboligase